MCDPWIGDEHMDEDHENMFPIWIMIIIQSIDATRFTHVTRQRLMIQFQFTSFSRPVTRFLACISTHTLDQKNNILSVFGLMPSKGFARSWPERSCWDRLTDAVFQPSERAARKEWPEGGPKTGGKNMKSGLEGCKPLECMRSRINREGLQLYLLNIKSICFSILN